MLNHYALIDFYCLIDDRQICPSLLAFTVQLGLKMYLKLFDLNISSSFMIFSVRQSLFDEVADIFTGG